MIDRRLRIHAQAEHFSLLHDLFVEEIVGLVQPDRHAERRLRFRDAGDVIEVGVRQQDRLDGQLVLLRGVQQFVHLVARIDEDPFAGILAAEDEAVLEKGGRRPVLQDHFHRVPQAHADTRLSRIASERASHGRGAGHGAPASDRVGESEWAKPLGSNNEPILVPAAP